MTKPENGYTGREWQELLRQMNGTQIKKSMRSAVRRVAAQAQKTAQGELLASGLKVKGDAADWKKGIRTRLYPDRMGAGFLVTVKARAASRKTGGGEKSMHKNRFGQKKPVLMWAEEGTAERRTSGRGFLRRRKGHGTGRMGAYRFMEAATPEMFRQTESGLLPEVEKAVKKVAAKCGF